MHKKNIISCQIAAQLASKSLEKELNTKEKLALKGHLAICKTCLFYYRQIKALRKVFPQYPKAISENPAPPKRSLSLKASLRIKKFLKEAVL